MILKALRLLPAALGAIRTVKGVQKAHVGGAASSAGYLLGVLQGSGIDINITQPTGQEALQAAIVLAMYVGGFVATWMKTNREPPARFVSGGGLY
jgi:energy-converting hydrogenase Eha subunit G